ncbi:MAG: type-F conjugative transfer system protein TraW [Novosphingobium sp. 12-63-9]|nr:MAG: type-F conjugative transfer system protein TraW [Novosphingobium sp. 12-63-9]
MKRLLAAGGGAALLGIAAFVMSPARIEARDYGQTGQAFPVIEPDLLSTVEARLKRVRRPTPVAGLSPATETRDWTYDPTVQLEHDIRDQKGNLIGRAGQRINPLDFVAIKQALVFVDGDDADQIAWATSRYTDLNAKIIFVSGSPIEEMTNRKRRFYFDQEGKLTSRFGIEHTPAVVQQNGRVMRVSEQVLKKGRAG